eukprot:CAMPEP_0118816426 /NCGR_PEP_ID=MMETSP1162-20130426/4762_1 /TAXON_ID=33656 /ORGANISM="Phaeocystis Sp, Strain CCMP2710" /LENGTH=480 /DNA_ID=CAMNT_0006746441 /DNA_START=89 /DNA_END=1531 /DNA_ORIENTATION=-
MHQAITRRAGVARGGLFTGSATAHGRADGKGGAGVAVVLLAPRRGDSRGGGVGTGTARCPSRARSFRAVVGFFDHHHRLHVLVERLGTLRHGLKEVGRGRRDGEHRRGHGEGGRDAEVHQERHEHDHVQGQPVQVVDGRAHVLRHDVSLQGADRRKVEPHAGFEGEECHEADLDVLGEVHGQVARDGHEHHDQADLLHGQLVGEVGVHARAEEAEDHEAGEDVPEWRHGLVGLHEARRPVEDKDEHRRLEGAADEPAEQDLLVAEDGAEGLAKAAARMPVALAVVLRPPARDVQHAQHEHHVGQIERSDVASVVHAATQLSEWGKVRGDLAELPSGNRRHAAAEVRQRERVAQLLAREALPLRLGHEPRVEHAEQQGRGDAAQDAAHHKHVEDTPVLRKAVTEVDDAVENSELAAPVLVSVRARNGADDGGGAETPDEQVPVVLAVDAVALVQGVDERTLQPVRQHGEQEPRQVHPLEAG